MPEIDSLIDEAARSWQREVDALRQSGSDTGPRPGRARAVLAAVAAVALIIAGATALSLWAGRTSHPQVAAPGADSAGPTAAPDLAEIQYWGLITGRLDRVIVRARTNCHPIEKTSSTLRGRTDYLAVQLAAGESCATQSPTKLVTIDVAEGFGCNGVGLADARTRRPLQPAPGRRLPQFSCPASTR